MRLEIQPLVRTPGVPLRFALYGLSLIWGLLAALFLVIEPEPFVPVAVMATLAFACVLPALFARDAVLERVWSNVSWFRY
jgi:hypothetical protein